MLKVPPPIWALAYLLVAAGISYLAGWLVRRRKADATIASGDKRDFSKLTHWALLDCLFVRRFGNHPTLLT